MVSACKTKAKVVTPKVNGENSAENVEVEIIEPKHIATRFQPGNKLGGRPKGVRNTLSERVLKDLLADWEEHGKDAIISTRLSKPEVYVKAIVSLIPKELSVRNGTNDFDAILDQFDDEQLAQVHGLLTTLVAAAKDGSSKVKKIT